MLLQKIFNDFRVLHEVTKISLRSNPSKELYLKMNEFYSGIDRYYHNKVTQWKEKGLLVYRNCPICESSTYSEYLKVESMGIIYSRCSFCNFVYLNPAPDSEATYNELYEEDCGGYLTMYDNELRPDMSDYTNLDLIRRRKASGKFLDFGCGTGWVLKQASEFYDVYGSDVSDYARNNIPINFHHKASSKNRFPGFRLWMFHLLDCSVRPELSRLRV